MEDWLFTTEPWDLPAKQGLFGAAQPFSAQPGQRGGQAGRLSSPMDNELPYGEPHMLAKVGAAASCVGHARAASIRPAAPPRRAAGGAQRCVASRGAPRWGVPAQSAASLAGEPHACAIPRPRWAGRAIAARAGRPTARWPHPRRAAPRRPVADARRATF
jgi:hypothetical protein